MVFASPDSAMHAKRDAMKYCTHIIQNNKDFIASGLCFLSAYLKDQIRCWRF